MLDLLSWFVFVFGFVVSMHRGHNYVLFLVAELICMLPSRAANRLPRSLDGRILSTGPARQFSFFCRSTP